jgi:hypothetical protein
VVGRELLTLRPLGEDHHGGVGVWGITWRRRKKKKMSIDTKTLIAIKRSTAFW